MAEGKTYLATVWRQTQLINCCGDIALAIEGDFEKYMPSVMSILQQAGETVFPLNNQDLVEYMNELRENILMAYEGVMVGMRAKPDKILPYTEGILKLLSTIAAQLEETCEEEGGIEVLERAVSLIGDMSTTLGTPFKGAVRMPPHREYLMALINGAKEKCGDTGKESAKTSLQLLGKA